MKQFAMVLVLMFLVGNVMAAEILIDTDDVVQPTLTTTKVESVKITRSMIDVTLYEGYMDGDEFIRSGRRTSVYYTGDDYTAFMAASEINIPATRTFISNNMTVEEGA